MKRFERSMSILDDVIDAVEEDMIDTHIRIDRRLVQETPFDTGRAKNGWLASVDRPDNREAPLLGPASKGAVESKAIDNSISVVAGAKNFNRLYLQNNEPHIQRLDEGWSEQQPNPFIDSIISEEVSRGNG